MRKVKMVYTKRIEFEVDMQQRDIDKIATEGVPDWLDGIANEIDNEQPVLFERFQVLKKGE